MTEHNPTIESAPEEGAGAGKPIEENLKSKATWTRLLFIVICCFLISISAFVGTFVVVLGFLWLLITGEVNQQLQQVGQSLATYIYEIVRYLTFNSDDKPFPLGGEWPSGKAEES
jgi:nitrate reductase NapE component